MGKTVSINKVKQGTRERMAGLWVPCEPLCCRHAWKNTCHTRSPGHFRLRNVSVAHQLDPPFPCTSLFCRSSMRFAYPHREDVYLPASFLRFYRALLNGLQYLSLDKTSPVYSRPGVIVLCCWMHQGHSPLLRMLCIISDSGIILERDSLHEGCYDGNSSEE